MAQRHPRRALGWWADAPVHIPWCFPTPPTRLRLCSTTGHDVDDDRRSSRWQPQPRCPLRGPSALAQFSKDRVPARTHVVKMVVPSFSARRLKAFCDIKWSKKL